MRASRLVIAVVLAIGLAGLSAAQTRYHVYSLGIGDAYGMNEQGQVVGQQHPDSQACRWTLGGTTLLLGGLPGGTGVGAAQSINELGQIVGWSMDSGGNRHAVLFDTTGSGANIDLGTLGGDWSEACAINNWGVIVGGAQGLVPPYYLNHPTVFDASGGGANYSLSGDLGGHAYDVNDNGCVVGSFAGSNTVPQRATAWNPGSGTWIDLQPDVWWFYSGQAFDINEVGQSVGRVTYEWGYHDPLAILFDPTGGDAYQILGEWDHAEAINDLGVAVGWEQAYLVTAPLKFEWVGGVWQRTDLNTVVDPNDGHAGYLWMPVDINNAGWIAVTASGPWPVSSRRAVLLKPIVPGDLNCDGSVGFADINPFVGYQSNFAAWQTLYPHCPPENGDINGDWVYPSFADINPFIALLAS